MKILIIGGGGREHALAWKIYKSPIVSKIFCAPGNAGTDGLAENVPIPADNIHELAGFAKKEGIDLTVVGPELPLTLGITDEFMKEGCKIFGVSKEASILEGSKAFTKEFLERHQIPTAEFEIFYEPLEAKKYIRNKGDNLVIKADGLAQGKGVFVCRSKEDALAAVDDIMIKKRFGGSGDRIVIEELLTGEEASFLVITDGVNILPLATSQDHKALRDGDIGPNTGGMGAYSPAPVITKDLHREIIETIIIPTVSNMKKEGRTLRGVLYAGLMISNGKPKVLEYNCRFGDPEIQPILMRMESDIVPILLSVIDGTLDKHSIHWSEMWAATVVIASAGYPEAYEKGKEIIGLSACDNDNRAMIFHAGTSIHKGRIVTSGGRVLGVGALGNDLEKSLKNAYSIVSKIYFDGVYYRRDIGKRGIEASKKNLEDGQRKRTTDRRGTRQGAMG